jgi:hypothetical protein
VGADLCDGADGCGHKNFFTAETRSAPRKADSCLSVSWETGNVCAYNPNSFTCSSVS